MGMPTAGTILAERDKRKIETNVSHLISIPDQ